MKHHLRTIDRIHVLVRLELGNPLMSSSELARLAGISIQRFSLLKKTPYYVQVHNQYLTGVIAKLDRKVDQTLKASQDTLSFAVPVAMQNLLKQALQEKDLRVQNKACNDILDRDGHFAKVTRHGLATPEQGGVVAKEADNKAAEELIQALKNSPALPVTQPSIDSPSVTETTQ